jgi:hypothetical protein
MRDLISNLGLVVALPAAAYGADNTPAAIDLLGFEGALIALEVGVGGITFTGTNKVEFKLTHSTDDVTYDAVTLEDVQGIASVGTGGIISSLIAAHANPTVEKIGYVGNRRYLKLLADFSGTHGSPTPISAIVIKGHPRHAPVS